MSDLALVSTETLVKELRQRGYLHYAVAEQSLLLTDLEIAGGERRHLMEKDTRRWVAESIGRFIWRSGDFPVAERDSQLYGTRTFTMLVPILLPAPKKEWPSK